MRLSPSDISCIREELEFPDICAQVLDDYGWLGTSRALHRGNNSRWGHFASNWRSIVIAIVIAIAARCMATGSDAVLPQAEIVRSPYPN